MKIFYGFVVMCVLVVGSCNTEDSYVIGLDKAGPATVEFWVATPTMGGTWIEVFFDNVSAGEISGYYSDSAEPDCGEFNSLTITKSPGTYDWTATAQNGSKFSGTVTFEVNTCTKVQLTTTNMISSKPVEGLVFTIRNVWQNTTYLNVKNGSVICSEVSTSKSATQWALEAGTGNNVLIKNKSTGTYLSMDNTTTLLSTKSTSVASQWTLDVLSSDRYRIRNVANQNDYINIETGPVTSSTILEGWLSAQWYFEKL